MARQHSVYRCADCGHDHPNWVGRCEACGEWNVVAEEPVVLPLGETRPEAIPEASPRSHTELLVLDSIRSVYTDELESAPGSVGQVRECAARVMRFAKESGTAVVVVGHVTKGGAIAGPKTLEHIVDTVLYFEGEATLDYRLLRTTKNRFGSVDELGVFSMTEHGLVAVPNPSAVFLAARADGISGSAVTALMEGTRPVLRRVFGSRRSGAGVAGVAVVGLDHVEQLVRTLAA